MAWRALTTVDVQTGLSAQEIQAVTTYALAPGQTDPTPSVIASTMNQVRGYVAAKFGGTPIGAEGTIPDELVDSAIDIAVWKLVLRFPGKLMANDARKTKYETALAQLKDVARGLFIVEMPTTPTAATVGVVLPSISNCGVRQRIRDEQNAV
jgi:hypothetical protein